MSTYGTDIEIGRHHGPESTVVDSKMHDVEDDLDEVGKKEQNLLLKAVVVSLIFMVLELVGGVISGSLAIMTDAAHMLTDIAGYLISVVALWMSRFHSSHSHSFGYVRAEVLGALLSVQLIWLLCGILVYEAILRTQDLLSDNPSEHVDGKLMFIVACFGIVANIVLMGLLGHSHGHGGHGHSHGGGHGHSHAGASHAHDSPKSTERSELLTHRNKSSSSEADGHGHSHGGHSGHGHSHGSNDGHGHGAHDDHHEKTNGGSDEMGLNQQAAYCHAVGDLLQSVGVAIAGGMIWYNPQWQLADPVATFLFSILVLATTVGVVKRSIHVLMEGTPDGVDTIGLREGLESLPNVLAVHDLHCWSLTVGDPSLSVHLVTQVNHYQSVLEAARDYLAKRGINHTTIQVEMASLAQSCDPCSPGQQRKRRRKKTSNARKLSHDYDHDHDHGHGHGHGHGHDDDNSSHGHSHSHGPP